jgi:Protein of unknown function (DUF3486)
MWLQNALTGKDNLTYDAARIFGVAGAAAYVAFWSAAVFNFGHFNATDAAAYGAGLVDGSFANYGSMSVWLRKRGYNFSLKTISKYGDKLEQRLEAVRLATAQARAVVEATNDDDDKMNEALRRLVQQHLFAVLVGLSPDPKQQNLTAIARSVAEMGKASIMQKKFVEEMQRKLAVKLGVAESKVIEAARAAAAMGEKGGLTEQAEEEIRRALMEVVR